MSQLSLTFNNLKGRFRVQTENRQKRFRPNSSEVNTAMSAYPNRSLAWKWFFHFCHEFLQVSRAEPLPAKTQSSSIAGSSQIFRICLPERKGGKGTVIQKSRNIFLQPGVGFGLEAA